MNKVTGMASVCTLRDSRDRKPIAEITMHGGFLNKAPYVKAWLPGRASAGSPSISVSIETGEVLAGQEASFREALPIIRKWLVEHQSKILELWTEVYVKGVKPTIVVPGDWADSVTGSLDLAAKSVRALPDHVLEVTFSNGVTKRIDFKEILSSKQASPLNNQAFFEKVFVRNGFPSWPGDIDIEPDDLFEIGEEYKSVGVLSPF